MSPICPAADDAVGLHRDPGGLSNLLAGQAASRFDFPQIASAKFFDECVESHSVALDERPIENASGILLFDGEHNALHRGQIVVDANRKPEIGAGR